MKQKKRKRDKNVIRKVLGSSDCEVFLSLDQTSFDCQEPNEPEQYISGEVRAVPFFCLFVCFVLPLTNPHQITINVRSEKMVSHGLYLLLYGEEAFRAYDGARNVRCDDLAGHVLCTLAPFITIGHSPQKCMQSIRKLKSPILASHFNILGGKSWDERKRSIVILHRGTYR